MTLLINGQVAEQFSYDMPGFQMALQTYEQAGGAAAGAELVIDMTSLDPQIASLLDQVGQFLIPYEGNPDVRSLDVEGLKQMPGMPQQQTMPGGQSMQQGAMDTGMSGGAPMSQPGGAPMPQPGGAPNPAQPPGPGADATGQTQVDAQAQQLASTYVDSAQQASLLDRVNKNKNGGGRPV